WALLVVSALSALCRARTSGRHGAAQGGPGAGWKATAPLHDHRRRTRSLPAVALGSGDGGAGASRPGNAEALLREPGVTRGRAEAGRVAGGVVPGKAGGVRIAAATVRRRHW